MCIQYTLEKPRRTPPWASLAPGHSPTKINVPCLYIPVFDKGLDTRANAGLRRDDSLHDQVLDGVPYLLRVDPQARLHVPPQSLETPLVTLADCFVSVRSELRVLLVYAVCRVCTCKRSRVFAVHVVYIMCDCQAV